MNDAKAWNWAHAVPWLLSIAAIIISFYSFTISKRALRLNENTSRAVIQPSDLELTADWSWEIHSSKQQPLRMKMKLSNSGKSLATNISVNFWVTVCYLSDETDPASGDHIRPCISQMCQKYMFDDLGPGASRPHEFTIDTDCFVPGLTLTSFKGFHGGITAVLLNPKFDYADSIGSYKDEISFKRPGNKNGVIKAGPFSAANIVAKGTVTLP
jgi:hypothetical protein